MLSSLRTVGDRLRVGRIAVAAALAVAASAAITFDVVPEGDEGIGPAAQPSSATSPDGVADDARFIATGELVPTGLVETVMVDAEQLAADGEVFEVRSAAAGAQAVPEETWDALAECESEGRWSIDTGNGFYGGLQFDLDSWQWAGGERFADYPHQATRNEQITIAERLLEMHPGGWAAWPACSAQLGLR